MNQAAHSFAILFWLKNQRIKGEKIPIYLRLTVNTKRVEIATHQSVLLQNWDQKAQRVKGKSPEAQVINRQLNIMQADIHKHYGLLLAFGKSITAETIKNAYLGIEEKQRTLREAFDIHNTRFTEKVHAGKKSEGTLKRLHIAKNKVLAFMQYQFHVSDKFLHEIRFAFAPDFEHFLTTIQGMTTNTATKYLKILKQVLKMSVEQGWLSSNPLAGFKCTYQETNRERLTMDEVELLYNKELHVDRLKEARDVFLFCCYTGFAYQDVFNLTPDNIVMGIDSEKWIMKNRLKTDSPEKVPLFPIPSEIIRRYSDHPYCVIKGRLLPVNSNQKYNAYLKEIAAVCCLKKHLTTHMARHTFATTITLEHDVPIETVSQMLGHKSIRTTQLYAKVTQRKVSNNMRELKVKLFGEEGKTASR